MQAFIFDVDGTILDTEKMYMLSLLHTLKQRGYDFTYDDVYKTFGLPSYEALEFLNIPNPGEVQRDWQSHYHDFWDEVSVFDGLKSTLSQLKQQHTMGLVTSNTAEEYANHSNAFNIDQYFDTFVFAGDTERMKPYPDPIEKAMHKLEVTPEESIYIGDSVHDMQAAHRAKAKFGLAHWGVKDTSLFGEADYIFDQPQDILELS
ncbi:HAD family hydrolase [Weissella uvarum]|nr:HAD family hydrolase [Weissella uvarum]MCM0595531.1 HAD family hydrolase [Weissella uvarum]